MKERSHRGGDVNQSSDPGIQRVQTPQKLPYAPARTLLAEPKGIYVHVTRRYLHVRVHCDTVHKSHDVLQPRCPLSLAGIAHVAERTRVD